MIENNLEKKWAGQISLALMCNIRHKFCFQTSFSTNRLSDEIIYEKLRPLYERMATLRILGGEPTIIPGIKEYIKWLSESYPELEIEIVTNGIAFDEEWINLAKDYGLMIQVSVNAISDEVFEKIMLTGDPLKYKNKIYSNLERLIDEELKSTHGIINCISMVLNDDSEQDLVPLITYALHNGVNFVVQLPADMANCNLNKKLEELAYKILQLQYFCDDYIEIEARLIPLYVREAVQKMISDGKFLQEKETFLKEINNTGLIRKSKNPIKNFLYCSFEGNCNMPIRGVSIMANGMVLPCCHMSNYPIGNLYNESCEEILFSEKRNKLQAMLNNNNYHYCWNRCFYNKNPQSSCADAKEEYIPTYRQMFSEGKYIEAIEGYDKIENDNIYGAQELYEHAFLLHVTGRNVGKSILLYTKALEKGFDEFWVRYNRADAYIRMEQIDKAKEDLATAYFLNPEHEGIKMLYEKYIVQEEK